MSNEYSTKRAYLELHFSVLLWGFTGILGRLIEIESTLLVWYRMLFTVMTLFFLKNLFKQIKSVDRKTTWKMLAIGSIIALHWVTFYGAIHLSNVSVAVGSFATTSLFTAFLEPLFTRRKIIWLEVVIGLLVTLGLTVMFLHGQKFTEGLIVGLVSALLAALFTIFNKILVDMEKPPPKAMTFIELGGGWLFLCLFAPIVHQLMPFKQFIPSQNDLIWLIILAAVCTSLPFILSLRALKQLSAFNSVLAINMEPIYSIILALIIFRENEELNYRFYIGTAIVVLSVFAYPMLRRVINGGTINGKIRL